MSKELEALNNMSEHIDLDDDYFYDKNGHKKDYAIIETALKEYELMKQTKIIVVDKKISDDDLEKLKSQRVFVGNLEQCEIKPLYDEEIQKKLKALEFIKEKGLSINDIAFIKNGETYETYIETMKVLYWRDEHLDKVLKTKEEYDLLKEILK